MWVVLGWLWGRNPLAIRRLCGGFAVALGGLTRLFRNPHSPQGGFRFRATGRPGTTRRLACPLSPYTGPAERRVVPLA
jgi:hypothetical protein